MSDRELRDAERAWALACEANDPSPLPFHTYNRLRERADLPRMCDCGEREVCTTAESEELRKILDRLPSCLECVEDALAYGHRHVGHDEAPYVVKAACPKCRRETGCLVVGCGKPVWREGRNLCREHSWEAQSMRPPCGVAGCDGACGMVESEPHGQPTA